MEAWAGYIAMEIQQGNVRETRSLYKRCHAKQLQDGGQLSLCQAWQRFEREHGSPEEHFEACLKTEPILAKVMATHTCLPYSSNICTVQLSSGMI